MTAIFSNSGVYSPKYNGVLRLGYATYGMRLEEEEQEDIDEIETLKNKQKQWEANKKKPGQEETDRNSEKPN